MKLVDVVLTAFVSFYSFAQNVDQKENIFKGTQLVNCQSSNLAEKGKLNLVNQTVL